MQSVLRYQDVLEPTWIPTYEEEIDALHRQLLAFNTHMVYIRKIENFRFDLFQITPTPFWPVVKNALVETSLLIIWKTAVDTNSDSLTLRRLKNEILKHWRTDKPADKKQFQSELEKVSFQKTVQALESKVKEIRHNFLAHFNRVWNTQSIPNRAVVYLFELENMLATSTSLFDLLCMGHGRALFYWNHLDESPHALNRVQQPDIDNLLDSVARHSIVLNLPEKDPDGWLLWRNHEDTTAEDRVVVNEYRVKFGLPEA